MFFNHTSQYSQATLIDSRLNFLPEIAKSAAKVLQISLMTKNFAYFFAEYSRFLLFFYLQQVIQFQVYTL